MNCGSISFQTLKQHNKFLNLIGMKSLRKKWGISDLPHFTGTQVTVHYTAG